MNPLQRGVARFEVAAAPSLVGGAATDGAAGNAARTPKVAPPVPGSDDPSTSARAAAPAAGSAQATDKASGPAGENRQVSNGQEEGVQAGAYNDPGRGRGDSHVKAPSKADASSASADVAGEARNSADVATPSLLQAGAAGLDRVQISLDQLAPQIVAAHQATPPANAASAGAGSAQSQPSPRNDSLDPTAASIGSQILGAFQAGSYGVGKQMVLRLNPPELGRVRLTLRADGTAVRGVVEVESARTLGEIQKEAPALMQHLAEGGVQVRRMEFVLSDPASSGSAFGQFADGHNAAPRQFSQDNPPGSWQAQEPEPAGEAVPAPLTPEGVRESHEGALNVWI